MLSIFVHVWYASLFPYNYVHFLHFNKQISYNWRELAGGWSARALLWDLGLNLAQSLVRSSPRHTESGLFCCYKLPSREFTIVLVCLPWESLVLDTSVNSGNWAFKRVSKTLIHSILRLPQSFPSALRPAVVKLRFVTEIIRILASHHTEFFQDRQSGRAWLNGPINLSIISSIGNLKSKC